MFINGFKAMYQMSIIGSNQGRTIHLPFFVNGNEVGTVPTFRFLPFSYFLFKNNM